MNILYRDRELGHIIRDADPVAVVAQSLKEAAVPAGSKVWTVAELRADAATRPVTLDGSNVCGKTPALIVYTSGTTGTPKGAVLTHNNLAFNATTLVDYWRVTDRDRFFLTLPLFHLHGLGMGLHCWLASGCLMRLQERFDHQTAAQQMRKFAPTMFFGVPAMYVRMLDWDEADARDIGATMRLFVSGSAPLQAHVLDRFRERYGHTILERYGMSETLINTSNPYDGERRAGSVGIALPGVEVRVVDGEVWVSGENVFREYWRNPQATAEAFEDGWFKTGDLGTLSDDGYLTLNGRRTDLIISGGFNIYPREVETVLLEQPGVKEAAVIGIPDAVRGEIPVAYVVCDDAWNPAALERECREHLASFKVPRRFTRVTHLPRTVLGKLQKHLLPPV